MSAARKLSWVLALAICVEAIFFFYDQTTGMVIETPVIENSRLADAFGGARVVQISDLHLGLTGVRARHLVKTIERVDPDIILITGDLIRGNHGVDSCQDLLGRLARGRTVITVLGNNDHSSKDVFIDTDRLVRKLRAAGVLVLMNETARVSVAPSGGGDVMAVYVVGVDDNFTGHDDIFKALENVPPGAPKILLAHAPAIIEKINTEGIDLVLSGHTHGGQIALPVFGALYTNPAPRTRRKYARGLYRDDVQLYINRGIGTVAVPMRTFSRPEVTLFQFVPEKRGKR